MIAIPISGIIGGPLSGALLGLDGWCGLAGWRWLFLLEGIPAVILGLVVLACLPERPAAVSWLTAEQRTWLTERLAAERIRCVERHGVSVGRALTSPIVWQIGVLGLLSISFGQYALGFWLPQIVKGLSGLSNLQIGFVSAIPNLVAVSAMVIVASHSDRTGERCLHIAVPSIIAAAGFLGCALVRPPALAILFLSIAAAGVMSANGPFWPLPSKFLSGSAAAGGIALINSLCNISGFAGPYAIGLLNNASGDFRSGFLLLACVPLCGMALAFRLRHAAVLRDVT
jgi:MFS family permease